MRTLLRSLVPLMLLTSVGCSSGEVAPPPASPEPPPPAAPPAQTAAATPTTPATAAPPPDPAAEKKKKEQAELAADFAAMEADAKKEAARFDDAMRAKVKALVEAKYPNAKAAIEATLKSPHRMPGSADRDKFRHPTETLVFFGLKQNQTVIEFGGGGGWYTEILAPVLAQQGKLLVTASDPNGPEDQRPTLYGRRIKRFLEKSPELGGKVELVVIKPDAPDLGHEGQVDLVLAMREMHGWVRNGRFDKNVAAVHKALKKGGVFGVEQHRAKPDANPEESAKQGYLPEAWVIQKVEAAGFKLAGKSEVNANPKDTKDYAEGVWTLPPNLALKDKDRDKYVAIGESDRMTLKFVKK